MEKIELSFDTIKKSVQSFKSCISPDTIYETQDFLRARGYTLKSIERASNSGTLMSAYDFRNKKDILIKFIKYYDQDDLNESLKKDISTLLIRSDYVIENQDLICDLQNNSYFLIIQNTPLLTLCQFMKENNLTLLQISDIISNILIGLNDIHNYNQEVFSLNPKSIIISNNLTLKILNIGTPINSLEMIQAKNPFLPKQGQHMQPCKQSNYYSIGAIICILCKLDIENNKLLQKKCKQGFFPLISSNNEYFDLLTIAFQMMNFNPSQRINCIQALQKIQKFLSTEQKNIVQDYLIRQVSNQPKLKGQLYDIKLQSNGSVFVGNIINKKREGKGTFINSLGERYEGNFVNDMFHGYGNFFDKEGNIYEGSWFEGEKQGRGILYYVNSDIYDGEFFNGKKHGKGTQYYDKKEIYEGEWMNDQRNGKGLLKLSNKEKYKGQFKNDKFNGKGKYEYKDGSMYDGEWQDNQRHGQGVYTFSNGDLYEGSYLFDKKQGHGIYKYKGGSIYNGEWKDDLKSGQGTYTASNKEEYQGNFENGKRSGFGIYTYNNGKVYQGEWKNDQKHGKGILIQDNIITYQGNWKVGHREKEKQNEN